MKNESNQKKKIAVIGGGIFGCTAAITLAKENFSVDIFEKEGDIMQAASGINQYRMHKGYHYPRSTETIISCRDATPEFEEEYKDAIVSSHTHYYCIAKENSFVSGAEYLKILDTHSLPHTVVTPDHINPEAVEVTIEAQENLYDPQKLKDILHDRLDEYGVRLHLDTEVTIDDLDEYDFIVVATYAASNSVFKNHQKYYREFQYEVCEKVVVEMPKGMEGISTVIMDGPFTCFDPLGSTGYAVIGHVEHAIHHRSVGIEPVVPDSLRQYLNKGIIKNPSVSFAQSFLKAASFFMPKLKDAKHVGSMFTIRTVLPRVDDTDTRPTIVESIDDRIITIYSGKIGNSVRSARSVVAIVKGQGEQM